MPTSFTSEEFKIIQNSKFFYTKASVTQKMDALLAQTRDEIKSLIEKEKIIFPKHVDARTGKIFRGENYRSLPYLILDYPKYFSKNNVFAFRTMFWWGKFFSCTLHIAGRDLPTGQAGLKSRPTYKSLFGKGVYFCINDNPWQYHYEKDNYVLIDKLSERKLKSIVQKNNFIKLSRKMELKDYRKLPIFAKESFSLFYFSLLAFAKRFGGAR